LTKTATVCEDYYCVDDSNWSIFFKVDEISCWIAKNVLFLLSFSCQVGMQKFESRYRRVEVEREELEKKEEPKKKVYCSN